MSTNEQRISGRSEADTLARLTAEAERRRTWAVDPAPWLIALGSAVTGAALFAAGMWTARRLGL